MTKKCLHRFNFTSGFTKTYVVLLEIQSHETPSWLSLPNHGEVVLSFSLIYFSPQPLHPAPHPIPGTQQFEKVERSYDHFITRCMYLKCHYSQRAQRRRKIGREKRMTLESPSTSLCSDVGEGGCLLCNQRQLQWCWDDLTSRTVLYFSEHSAIFYVACLKECLKQVSTCEGYNTGHTKAKSLEERTETNVFAQELAWELRFPWPPTSVLPWSSAFL